MTRDTYVPMMRVHLCVSLSNLSLVSSCLRFFLCVQLSLPDLHSGSPAFFLDSQDMVPHLLGAASSSVSVIGDGASRSELLVSPAIDSVARSCAAALREKLGLTLFGFDLIQAADDTPSNPSNGPSSTSPSSPDARYFILDINYFPSYKNLPDLATKLITACLRRQT